MEASLTPGSQISTTEAVQAVDSDVGPGPRSDAPVAIEVRSLHKTFRIPSHRIDSFKERAAHPFASIEHRKLEVLRNVSFDVRQGEFFGVVGRNGSGKSTLLKILASIYGTDRGTIRMTGRLAPFIELGVGFNADLAARDNIVLNGVLMGLTRREARARVDAVLDFAELRDFSDLKLKNYSSGMTVRLAFAVMIQSEADILLIDEVLAVGDAAFQQKCADVFHDLRDAGTTIVLVTHDMGAIQTYCHRAMLIHDGEIRHIGDPEEIGRRYLRLNFAPPVGGIADDPHGAVPDVHARVDDAWLEGAAGERLQNLEGGQPLRLNAVIEARTDLVNPVFAFHCYNAENVHVFGFNHRLEGENGAPGGLVEGERLRLSWEIENFLTSGHYFIKCWVARDRRPGDMALQALDLIDFVVYNVEAAPGIILVDPEVKSAIEGPER